MEDGLKCKISSLVKYHPKDNQMCTVYFNCMALQMKETVFVF